MQREGFGIRVGAAIIDAVLLQAVSAPLILVIAKNVLTAMFLALLIPCTGGQTATDADAAMNHAANAAGILFLLTLVYSLTDVCFAGTPGKRLLGLRILNDGGEPASLSQRMGRWSIKYSWLGPYAIVLGLLLVRKQSSPEAEILLWVARVTVLAVGVGFFRVLRPEKQAFHDAICRTAVYRLTAHQEPHELS